MNLNVIYDLKKAEDMEFEVVERKGRGHPDTLADRLAEKLAQTYSKLSLEKFGTILRHQFDKLTLMGGKCDVFFGGGAFVSPIRLLINGRATPEVGKEKLAYRDALLECSSDFLESELKNFDFLTNCRVIIETTANTTRGLRTITDGEIDRSSPYSRFRPKKLTDLPEYTRPLANDTSMGCGWAPYSPLEQMILEIENKFNSDLAKQKNPWIGSDIKIMGIRSNKSVTLTLCVPQISSLVPNLAAYKNNIVAIESMVQEVSGKYKEYFDTKIFLNTADGQRDDLVYMLYTGSCIESGDESQVGRGNRIGGLIASRRPYSMEGLSGKNSQYHAGKIYSVMAWELARKIWELWQVPSEVYIVSQSDQPIDNPWNITINAGRKIDIDSLRLLVEEYVSDVNAVTNQMVTGDIKLV